MTGKNTSSVSPSFSIEFVGFVGATLLVAGDLAVLFGLTAQHAGLTNGNVTFVDLNPTPSSAPTRNF